jgi:hypothetical protein
MEPDAVTRKSPTTTEFIPLSAALAHMAACERAPKLALTRALAGKMRARGFVRYAWPPYNEGDEQLDPELFTDYPPQHPCHGAHRPAVRRFGSRPHHGKKHPRDGEYILKYFLVGRARAAKAARLG